MILVTGGSGFLGSKLVDELRQKGRKVRVFDQNARKLPGVEVIKGDITNYGEVLVAMKGCSVVFHLAALLGHHHSQKELDRVNMGGTANVMKAAKEVGAKVIYCSSVTTERGDTRYSKSKKKAEEVALKYSKEIPVIIIRPAPLYGQESKRFDKLFEYIQKGALGKIGSTDYTTHMADRDHVVQAFLLAEKRGKPGETYTIADTKPIRASELYGLMCKRLGAEEKVTPYWLAFLFALIYEIRFKLTGRKPSISIGYLKSLTVERKYDISKAVKELGYKPIATQEGVERMVDSYLKKGKQ